MASGLGADTQSGSGTGTSIFLLFQHRLQFFVLNKANYENFQLFLHGIAIQQCNTLRNLLAFPKNNCLFSKFSCKKHEIRMEDPLKVKIGDMPQEEICCNGSTYGGSPVRNNPVRKTVWQQMAIFKKHGFCMEDPLRSEDRGQVPMRNLLEMGDFGGVAHIK